ncbi:Protein CBG17565 [Caenorhabditis briggsae]|uniref:Protein CBG17565 n=2 Tax=Caenorhabditis briggsae TaxID=6238 RepID=A8XR92_CAEBR|nr:Protein CBG17565 [Caenorhabditis briggsae]ULT81125.1 hypothetical protein L3Y34_011185 [Caenorhabditis briggsae]CAP35189.1 Protein CBG17565 [Caenorhabditis briggsae]
MKVAPVMDEVFDLRRKIHIMNAENFIRAKNEHSLLIAQVDGMKIDTFADELKEKVEAIRRKGAYYSVRGGMNFVRYTKSLSELNTILRRILSGQQINIDN